MNRLILIHFFLALTGCGTAFQLNSEMSVAGLSDRPQYTNNPHTFEIQQSFPAGDIRGSIFAHDVNNDGIMEFVITSANRIAVYGNSGENIWISTDDIHLPEGGANGGSGYPGIHAPGAIAGQMDADAEQEVAYMTFSGQLKIRNARTGDLEKSYSYPGGQALAIANFRGQGEKDAIIQYSQTHIRAVNLENGQSLWERTDWLGIEHSPVRVLDMDKNGLDDVVGASILNHQGNALHGWDLARDRGTELSGLDSYAIGDVQPGGPLEVVYAETSGNLESVAVNSQQILWGTRRDPNDIPNSGQCAREKDPDKIAIGNFDPSRPGLEVFARSSCALHPWIMDSNGQIISRWNVAEKAPSNWCILGRCGGRDTEGGLEAVSQIDWHGDDRQVLLGKERHTDGKVAVVDPMNGTFTNVFPTQAARVYAADVAGDHRDEVIVVETNGTNNARVKIFWNANSSLGSKARAWLQQVYRRQKQNWNYYSP